MDENTPNEEYLNWWLDRMKEQYQYEKLRDMSLDRLHNMEYEVESRFKLFEATFPDRDSEIQGKDRAFLYDDPNATRENLTTNERIRMKQAKEEMKHEIYRAKGTRLEKRREHRSKILNGFADLADAIAKALGNMWPW